MGTGYRNYKSNGRFSVGKLVFILILFALVFALGVSFADGANERTSARVLSVSDGDTIRVRFNNGRTKTVRLLGLDTPETHHPTKPVGCYGEEAEKFTRNYLGDRDIMLEFDVQRTDKYGRTLAYVYVEGNRFNDELLRQGYARALIIEPNMRYANEFVKLEVDARNNRAGLWGICDDVFT